MHTYAGAHAGGAHAEHATLAHGIKKESGEHGAHAPSPAAAISPTLPKIRQQSVVGAFPPPPSECLTEASMEGPSFGLWPPDARQHAPRAAPGRAAANPQPPAGYNGSAHSGGTSPRKHKPLKWSVVPTSMVMTNGAAYRPMHHDAAARVAPGFTVSSAALASGVPLTGLRDSTLSEALPALATISKPGAMAAIVPSLAQPPDGLVGRSMPPHATPPMRRGAHERAGENSVPSGTMPSPRRKHGSQAASPVPLYVDFYAAVATEPEACGVAVDAQGPLEPHVASADAAPTSTVRVSQLMAPSHHQRTAALSCDVQW